MRFSNNFVATVATAAAFVAIAALPASAECKRYGFSVNDYGKDGPTKDSKDLLDKYIATAMGEKGVKDYKTGTKSVSCELFLNFIVFDEHTCTASATVCWGGSSLPGSEQADDTSGDSDAATKTSSDETATPKESKQKKKDSVAESTDGKESADGKKSSEPAHKVKHQLAQVPDPKPSKTKAKEAAKAPDSSDKPADSAANTDKSDAAKTEPSTSTAKADQASTPVASKTADGTKAADGAKPADSASKPVETGSITEPEKKPAKHKHKSTDSTASGDVAPVKSSGSDSGYPTPVAPGPGDNPSP